MAPPQGSARSVEGERPLLGAPTAPLPAAQRPLLTRRGQPSLPGERRGGVANGRAAPGVSLFPFASRCERKWAEQTPPGAPRAQSRADAAMDKEYVGFATLPNQLHRKSVKKGFDFTLMVAGESGLGKSTLIDSLFLTDLYKDRTLLDAQARIPQTLAIERRAVELEEGGVRVKLTVVDTPGFGDAVDNADWSCCLYFLSPFGHGLRPLDVAFLCAVQHKVNIVPVIGRADVLTPREVGIMKEKIRQQLEENAISIYQFPDCDSDEDEDFKAQDAELKGSIPFAVVGSNDIVRETKGKAFRGRTYPWGAVEVENPAHCDFLRLRTMLVRTHMQDLKEVTQEIHYENYRARCIQSLTRVGARDRGSRMKLSRQSATELPLLETDTEKLIREKDEELRRMQEMLQKMHAQIKQSQGEQSDTL
ncbi:septin-1 [Lepidochelys kempii]|uniref:septin-1 n=1 Tax=Lepidochelys kempii TaxID=8472 RepID=UPI003C6F2A71